MSEDNFIIKCIDIEYYLLQFLDIPTIITYSRLSKSCNELFKKTELYKALQDSGHHCHSIIEQACWSGHEKLLDCVVKRNRICYSCKPIDFASSNGHVHILNYWLKSGLKFKYTENAIDYASCYGHVEVLKWWKTSGLIMKYSHWAMDWASQMGHIDVLNWWKKSGLWFKYSTNAKKWAKEREHKDVIEWWNKYLVN